MQLREVLKKREPKNSVFNPPYTTLQIGGISGGIARNVIADRCKVDWELRPIVKEDGVFVNNEIDKFVKKEFSLLSSCICILHQNVLINSFSLISRSISTE